MVKLCTDGNPRSLIGQNVDLLCSFVSYSFDWWLSIRRLLSNVQSYEKVNRLVAKAGLCAELFTFFFVLEQIPKNFTLGSWQFALCEGSSQVSEESSPLSALWIVNFIVV